MFPNITVSLKHTDKHVIVYNQVHIFLKFDVSINPFNFGGEEEFYNELLSQKPNATVAFCKYENV